MRHRGGASAALVAALVLVGCAGDDPDAASPVDVLGEGDTVGDDTDEDRDLEDTSDGPADTDPDDASSDGPDADGDVDGTDDDGPADGADDAGVHPIDEPVTDAARIDEAHLADVLSAIDATLTAMADDVQRSGGWTDSAAIAVAALYSDTQEAPNEAAWQEIVELGFVAEPPEAGEAVVVEILSATPDCVAVVADRHTGTFFTEDSPFPTEPRYLVGLQQDPDLVQLGNPTVWEMFSESIVLTEEEIVDVCDPTAGRPRR